MKTLPDVSDKIDALHIQAKALLAQNYTEEEILAVLCREGIDVAYAKTIIENVETDTENNKTFKKLLFTGIAITIGGLLINYFSYQLAANTGSFFFYFYWGIVAFGIVTITRAFYYRKN